MKKTATIVTALLAALLIAIIPAFAGENILASGTVTLAAGSTNATQTIGLYNTDGQEWGEIVGFRLYNGSTNTVNVLVTCEDMDTRVTLAHKDSTYTNAPAHLAAAGVYSVAGTSLYAKTVRVQVSLFEQTNVVAATCPYYIYAK